MKMHSRIGLGLTLIVLASAGCGTTEPPAPCSGDINVTVRGEFQPTFDWSRRCGISSLSVLKLSTQPGELDKMVWGFSVSERQPVGPSIVYGNNPVGSTVSHQPETLVPGAQYRVTILYTVGGDGIVASGSTTFVGQWGPDQPTKW